MGRLNLELLKVASFAVSERQQGRDPRRSLVKTGFVPPGGGDPAAGGAPPGGPPPGGDPMAGGPPPGGDPMAGGPPPGPPPGGPPMDPSMGGMPPMPPPPGPAPDGGGPGGPDIAGAVQKAVGDALAQSGLKGNMMGPNGKPTAPKPDINTIATDVFQLKKMFLHYLRTQGIELPPDILDGPNRDPLTGAPAMSPTGGSDVQPGASAGGAGGAGPQSAIKPIEPMQGAFPSPGGAGGGAPGGGGMGKTSAWDEELGVLPVGQPSNFARMRSKVAAVARLCRSRNDLVRAA